MTPRQRAARYTVAQLNAAYRACYRKTEQLNNNCSTLDTSRRVSAIGRLLATRRDINTALRIKADQQKETTP